MSILDYSNFDDDENEEGRADRFEDELKKYKDMLGDGSSDITNIEALEEIVNFFFDNERYEEALRFVDRMLTHIPYSADTWQRKGLILSNLNRPAEALEAFTMALNLNPVDTEILVNRGIALMNWDGSKRPWEALTGHSKLSRHMVRPSSTRL